MVNKVFCKNTVFTKNEYLATRITCGSWWNKGIIEYAQVQDALKK